ncbi:MAG: 23S rRNA (pseudouridine(1915)-N(3))-methyltransferase RlmH [Bacteroidetes bacterium]|nr:23S rRNA (pseudouridine(1915)-N(3))-methyltransferase RlmH [Bacteroidota bacterium]
MTITLICTGKTSEQYVSEGMKLYLERLKHYCKFDLIEIESGKGDESQIRKKETESILTRAREKYFLILLDEKGKEMNSIGFSDLIRHHQNISTKNFLFVIGGAYGFSEEVYKRANLKIALSKMTFPHQLVRVIFLEQLYRAMTILKGEKYHH